MLKTTNTPQNLFLLCCTQHARKKVQNKQFPKFFHHRETPTAAATNTTATKKYIRKLKVAKIVSSIF